MVNSSRIYAWLGITSTSTTSTDLVTSPVFSPFVLACIRLTLATYALTTSITVLAYNSIHSTKHDANGFFSYFTDLSYIGLVAYFWASGVQTLAFAFRGRSSYPLQNWPRPLRFLHRLLHSTITTFPIIVTIVYWSLLSGGGTFLTTFSTWSNISQHAMNTAFALFEILFTNAGPNPWSHLPFLLLMLAGYLGVAYITHASEGFYTYSFLDPNKEHGYLAAYIVGIGVGECIVFAVVWGISHIRARIAIRAGRGPGSTDVEDVVPEEIDEWQEIARPKTPSIERV